MCLGVPMRVVERDGFMARCDAKGIERIGQPVPPPARRGRARRPCHGPRRLCDSEDLGGRGAAARGSSTTRCWPPTTSCAAMHELAVCQSLLREVERAAAANGCRRGDTDRGGRRPFVRRRGASAGAGVRGGRGAARSPSVPRSRSRRCRSVVWCRTCAIETTGRGECFAVRPLRDLAGRSEVRRRIAADARGTGSRRGAAWPRPAEADRARRRSCASSVDARRRRKLFACRPRRHHLGQARQPEIGRDPDRHPERERSRGGAQSRTSGSSRHPRRQSDVIARIGQDQPARSRPSTPSAAGFASQSSKAISKPRTTPRRIRAKGVPADTDHDRPDLPSRRAHGARRAARARPRRDRHPVHRKCRQPGVPGELRSRPACERHAARGHRRRRQAGKIPDDVPRRRSGCAVEDRSARRARRFLAGQGRGPRPRARPIPPRSCGFRRAARRRSRPGSHGSRPNLPHAAPATCSPAAMKASIATQRVTAMADTRAAKEWLERIRALPLRGRIRVMNVCGGHERSISMAGLRARAAAADRAHSRARLPGLRLSRKKTSTPRSSWPCARTSSSSRSATCCACPSMRRKREPRSLRTGARGRRRRAPDRFAARSGAASPAPIPIGEVVFFAAGFETTTAPVAAMLAEGVPDNLSVLLVGTADLAGGRDAARQRASRVSMR